MRWVLLALLLACGSRPSTALRWASDDLGCPEEELEVVYVDLNTFEVIGCNYRALYFCPSRESCERFDGPPPPEDEQASNLSPPE
ncbi:MAG: hypothetical protein AAGE52_29405 [Myxococcota bacterium]